MLRSVWLCILVFGLAAFACPEQTIIRMMGGPGYGIPPKEATDPRSLARRAVFEEFQRQNPDVRVMNAGGLELVGQQADSLFLMSMAGANAPDIFYVNFRQYYNFIDQGFCRPLDDFVARDPKVLDRANPIILDVIKSYDGHIYAIPWFQVALGLYYRKDHLSEAGLDPQKPPKTWDELLEYCKRIVESDPNRAGFAFSNPPGYLWSNFVYQAGGEVVGPTETGVWKSKLGTPQAAKAVDFFRRLVNEKWKGKDGKIYGPAAKISVDYPGDIRQGKVSMWFAYTNDVVLATANDLPPSLIGCAAMPAGPGGSSNEINAGSWAINATIKDPKKLEACWKFIQFFAGEEAARVNTQRFVEMGMANLVNPLYLEKFGFKDLVAQVDPTYVKANRELFKNGHPEPYGRNCQQVYTVLDNALDKARLDPNTPAIEILKQAQTEMDEKLLGYKPPDVVARERAWAIGILTGFVLVAGVFAGWQIFRAVRNRQVVEERLIAGSSKARIYGFIALCLAPAVASLLVWAYYPLARGLQIAFQDYKIIKGERWVGLDNFIQVFTSPIFYKSLMNSFVYVGLSLLIGFFMPIILALMLNEIPRGKVFFRTVFYLPAMTSPIVIAFLWRQFYDKTEQGLLNVILAPFINLVNPLVKAVGWAPINLTHDWLGDPTLAMLAVVLPGIWAGAGPGSILYLAALKNVPQERYEAADLDGANWIHKILYITLPGIKPLVLINLLGVFIAGFKATENIFVLTFGGPLDATNTLGLEIWKNAFMFLKFGYATAAAWVMGAILIGFTLIQIRSLLKMRFSTAKL
ncbi:MAG: extracellular solute-binding protein [Armatimonadetes bacterium]|nr:extracellular solute-binding protein [Armatimonadota bacterium]